MEETTWSHGKILPVQIDKEMKSSYIDYAMSVIVMRALPDVRDGMKPVHRRILYAMHETGMTPNKPYKKSARIVGDVLGKYHPHGDSSVYDATVRLAQDFSTRYPLVDGHGNFGSIDGDSAAAMRYTEVRMAKITTEMLADIDKDTVDFMPNYDESLQEPTVLPSKIPNLLINGSAGIAVGMATNIPPHNLNEVADGLIMLIDNPDVEVTDLMKAIKGPDFPTGALILGRDGIKKAYSTGRGSIKMRARARIEEMNKGKHRIVVTEIPYQVNKARVIESIAALSRDKVIDGITALRDESDRQGLRIVVELRADIQPDIVLNKLYKHTQLQETFGVIMLALVDGHPKILTLKEVLNHYIAHRLGVIVRRTQFELNKAEARAHILEGLLIALDHIDEVIATIRASETDEIAKNALMSKFGLTEKQAVAILDMRLRRLTGLEREKIEEEYKQLELLIADLKAILASEDRQRSIIKEELTDMKHKYGDERRSEITVDTSELDVEDLIADEEMVITLTRQGYIKRMNANVYRNQHKGGVGVVGMKTKEDDDVEILRHTRTKTDVLFFTDFGRVYRCRGYQIQEGSRTSKGLPIVNFLKLNPGEKVTSIISMDDYSEDSFLFFGTEQGVVKRCKATDFENINSNGKIAILLRDGDKLIDVKHTDGSALISLGSTEGKVCTFREGEVRCMGRSATGVKGMDLPEGEKVVGMITSLEGDKIFSLSANGYGKITPGSEYRITSRGSKGVKTMRVEDKNGALIAIKTVKGDEDIIIITDHGTTIRTTLTQVSNMSRNTIGVKIITLRDKERISSCSIAPSESEYEATEETAEEAVPSSSDSVDPALQELLRRAEEQQDEDNTDDESSKEE